MRSTPLSGAAEAPRSPGARRVIGPGGVPPGAADATGADAADGRLLRPAASCPRCGARPALRVTGAMVRALRGHDAATRIGTYQCQRRGCGAIYDLCAGAYLRAS
jgi:hypothetical protein